MSRKVGATLGSRSEDEAAQSSRLPSIEPLGPASRRDQLVYLADMASELATIADRLGCPTLAALLDLARREAGLEAGRDH